VNRGAIVLFFCIFLASPASASPQTCWISGNCGQYVGKRLWVAIPAGNPNTVEATLTRGDWTTSRTLKLKTGASFLVAGIENPESGSPDYRVKLADGRTAWVESASPFLVGFDPIASAKNAAAECARRGQPKIGMTVLELTGTCWGKPRHIVKKTTASGTEERFLYGLGHIVKLTDGRVSEIISSQ
jgi:hypothetical protein